MTGPGRKVKGRKVVSGQYQLASKQLACLEDSAGRMQLEKDNRLRHRGAREGAPFLLG